MTHGEILWWLLVGHAVADYWAQSDSLAKMKNRNRDSSAFCPPGQTPQAVWPYALGAHGVMHGAAVAIVTGSVALGLAEAIAHAWIDFGKCENWYGIHVDQALHLLCKGLWFVVAVKGWPL